ncbi:single-stranded DNA-binding protein [Micrococcus luteus]|nr:single-stranded DNA-binding protein [Micrococcus luteus]
MSVTVSVTLTEAEYAEVERKAKEKGLSVAQYVKRFPIAGDEFDERYEQLKKRAKSQPLATPFTVMSLFSDWNEIPRGVKLSLGRNFYHLVKRNEGEVQTVKTAGKNSSNVQLYVREEG